MTTITLFKQNGQITGFVATGHCEYAKRGEDIICAAASMITQSTILGIREVAGLGVMVKQDDQTAHLEATLPANPDPKKFQSAQIILKTMELALKNLQDQYPEYIKLKEEAK